MALVTLNEILAESVANKYAVGAFGAAEHGLVEAILTAAEETNAPVILMLAERFLRFVDMDRFVPYVLDRIDRTPVPVVLHLDHGTSLEACVKAINYGFSSVMIDGSDLPYKENVALVKKVVAAAHGCGVSVEAELGNVGGVEGNLRDGVAVNKNVFTQPEEAAQFAKDTDIDALAVAIGTAHGIYKGDPEIDFDLLRRIRAVVKIPLVLHGGTGLTPGDYRKAVGNGINKINFFTGVSQAAIGAVKQEIADKKGYVHYHQIVDAGLNKAKEAVKELIGLFDDLS